MAVEGNVGGKKFDGRGTTGIQQCKSYFSNNDCTKGRRSPDICNLCYEISYKTRGIRLSSALVNFEDVSENKLKNEDYDEITITDFIA